MLKHFEELCDAAVGGGVPTPEGCGREGISLLWEYVTELLASDQDVEQFPKYIQAHVRRIYTGYAAAAQTGMGNPMRRGLADVAKQSQPLLGDDVLADLPAPDPDEETPRWLHLGAHLLEAAGWAWPIAAEPALDAAAGCGIESRRRGGAGDARRSPLAAHPTGVPANTWAALELLALGSSPGCRPEHRWPGLILMSDTHDRSTDTHRSQRHPHRQCRSRWQSGQNRTRPLRLAPVERRRLDGGHPGGSFLSLSTCGGDPEGQVATGRPRTLVSCRLVRHHQHRSAPCQSSHG